MNNTFQDLLDVQHHFSFAIICGMAKTGTTLTLSLLDDHPQLTVFPEELRFMDAGCHRMENTDADEKLLSNSNIQHLKVDKVEYHDLKQSHGTGYGLRDHSNLDFDIFSQKLKQAFSQSNTPLERYIAVFYAYTLAKGQSIESLLEKPLLVSKAPHNEVFMHSWQKMFTDRGLYIWMVRDPFEHYYSMTNIAKQVKANAVAVDDFCHLLVSRLELMLLQTSPTIFVKYEDLINEPIDEIAQIAQFLSIDNTEGLQQPTKNGVVWQGNSSRGKKAKSIFSNPNVAKQKLSEEDVMHIENKTTQYRKLFNY